MLKRAVYHVASQVFVAAYFVWLAGIMGIIYASFAWFSTLDRNVTLAQETTVKPTVSASPSVVVVRENLRAQQAARVKVVVRHIPLHKQTKHREASDFTGLYWNRR